jgi:hypothetical protein
MRWLPPLVVLAAPVRLGPVALIVVAVAIGSACGGEVKRSDLPISDDFSGDCEWSQDNDEHISLGCEDGAYRAQFKRADERIHHWIPRRIQESAESVSVEADVTLASFPGGSSDDFQGHGVGCWASPVGEPLQGYSFIVAPGVRSIAVLRHDETDESLREQFYIRALVDEQSGAVAPIGETGRIRGECEATGDGGVDLTMYLDGEQVAKATDRPGFRPFEAFGFIVISTKVGTDIRFDNFEADEVE